MNLGLLGAIGGIGQGISTIGAGIQKQQDEQAQAERSLIMNQKLLQVKDDMEAARQSRIASDVKAEAQNIASKRGEAGLLSARRAVSDAGNQDDPAVAQGLNDAQAELSTPTLRDQVQASVNLGHTKAEAMLAMEKQDQAIKAQQDSNLLGARKQDAVEHRDENARIRDEARLALQDRKVDIDSKRVDAMIAGIGAWAKHAGASGSQTTAMIQNYAELERRGYPKEKIEQVLFEGKPPAESFEMTTKPDPMGGPALTSTKQRGGGAAPVQQNDPLGLRKSK